MALRVECDRCGSIVKAEEVNRLELVAVTRCELNLARTFDGERRRFFNVELCDVCVLALREFLQKREPGA